MLNSTWKSLSPRIVAEPLPKSQFPTERPRTATRICSATWSWGPVSSRQDEYYLSSTKHRTHWLLWLSNYDEDGRRWNTYLVAYGVKAGVSAEEAAVLLLLLFWREDDLLNDPPHEHYPGLLPHSTVLALSSAVWPQSIFPDID